MVRQNYILALSHKMNNFFANSTDCFVLKDDFINYKNSLQSAKSVLSAIYKKAISGNRNFNAIIDSIEKVIEGMHSKEDFNIKLMNGLKGPRGYINSTSLSQTNGYYYLRACCIPFVSFIRVLKLEEASTGRISYYIKLFPNFDEMYQQVQYITKYGKSNSFVQTNQRLGQTNYKKELLQQFGECPFTHIHDERLLVASHIQPFASCCQSQKFDVENGLLLSPLYDRLFDRGFITFDQRGQLKKTIWLSPDEWNKIPLDYQIQDLHLTTKRKQYLQFHETHVFLGD